MRRMTNKEAIEVLDAMKVKIEIPKAAVTQYKRNVSLDMAIEALQLQQDCKAMDDSISRQAAIDAVKRNTFRLTFAEEQNCEGHVAWSAKAVYSDVMESELLELPSVQPEIIRCKDCKHWDKTWTNNWSPDYHYCPVMDEVRKGNLYCRYAERRTDE